MKKCDICKTNEPSVSYREVINGKEKCYSLCPTCASVKEKEISAAFKDIASPVMGGLFDGFFSPRSLAAVQGEAKRCDLCGSTFKRIAERGRVGCPKCYFVFEKELEGTIKRLHGNVTHCSRPEGKNEETAAEDEKTALEKELRAAIEKEEYERAAEIRDKLKALRGGEGA